MSDSIKPWFLRNLNQALDVSNDGKVYVRTGMSGDIIISGAVNIPGSVDVEKVGNLDISSNSLPVRISQSDSIPVKVAYSDSANLSAFSRLRTASTRLLGEFRNMYGTTGPVEILTKFVNGGSQTVNLDKVNTDILVTTAAGSSAIRQSRQYHPYIPGTTNLAFITYTFGIPKNNLQQSVGLFDDDNGLIYRLNSTTPEFVIRKNGVDEQIVQQSSWNVDKFDGTGPSGLVLDNTKSQVLVIDYQWLGVGRVRFGFDIDGQIFYAHYFTHANKVTEPYMLQPSLPIRWQLLNTGPTDSPSKMKTICFSVYVEGNDTEAGFDHAVSSGVVPVTVTNAKKCVLAIRLKDLVNDKPVRAFGRLKEWEFLTTQNIHYSVIIAPDDSAIMGTTQWNTATPVGWSEYAMDLALVNNEIPPGSIVLADSFAAGGVANKDAATTTSTESRSAMFSQNIDSTNSQVVMFIAERLGNQDAIVHASFKWKEIK